MRIQILKEFNTESYYPRPENKAKLDTQKRVTCACVCASNKIVNDSVGLGVN